MELKEFSPIDTLTGYVVQNSTLQHYGTVVNRSLDTIKSFIVNYRRGNSYVLSDVINVTVPPLTEYIFTHKILDTIANIGRTNITAWVSVAGDTNPFNDTAYSFVHGAHFKPQKLVLVEEGTSAKNEYGPRGHVYMNNLSADNNLCQISIHSQDPMGLEGYSSYLYSLNYYSGQYFLLDRQFVEPTELFKQFDVYNRHFGFADLEVTGNVYNDIAEINITVKPAVDITGDFRLVLVLIESDVSGTTKDYNQVNGYMNSFQGWGPMGGYENKTNPVLAKDMKYNHVARLVEPNAGGVGLGTELKHGGTYQKFFQVKLHHTWNRNRMSAIVMLYNNDDTLILNSNRLSYFLNVAGADKEEKETGIYPNPADDFTTLEFDAEDGKTAEVIVADVSGRIMQQTQIAQTLVGKNQFRIDTSNLPNGLYIINVKTGDVRHALKLQVMH